MSLKSYHQNKVSASLFNTIKCTIRVALLIRKARMIGQAWLRYLLCGRWDFRWGHFELTPSRLCSFTRCASFSAWLQTWHNIDFGSQTPQCFIRSQTGVVVLPFHNLCVKWLGSRFGLGCLWVVISVVCLIYKASHFIRFMSSVDLKDPNDTSSLGMHCKNRHVSWIRKRLRDSNSHKSSSLKSHPISFQKQEIWAIDYNA